MATPEPARPNAPETLAKAESTLRGVTLTLVSAFFAAVYFIPFKVASSMSSRGVVVLAVMLVAAIANTLLTLRRQSERPRLNRITALSILVLGALTVTGNYCIANALVRVGAGATSVLLQTQLLVVALGGWLLLRERISRRYLVGAAIVVVGLVILERPGASFQRVAFVGLLYAMGGTLGFAFMVLWTRYAIHSIQPVFVNAMRLWFAVTALLCAPGVARAAVEMPSRVWLLCAAAAFAGPVISRLTNMYGLRDITASRASLIGLSSPVVAFALDYLLLDAVPEPHQLVGAVVIIMGIGLPVMEMLGRREGPARARESAGA